jgi:hypothetical protein
MTGEVDVRRVILDALPPAPTPTGARVQLTGRARGPVSIERAEDGSYREVARATPGGDARWSAWVTADHAADYRAVSGSGVSQTRRLLVSDRKVRLRATRRGVVVTVSPALPGGRVTLQMDLRERFGWWPVARRRLDYVSRATFTVRRRGRVRAILVDRDGWTPLATSVVLGFRPRR